MPYAPWISPKSGNYLHSRQVRKRRGRRSKRVRRNYSRSAKLLPAAVRISLNEQFSIAPTLFNASVHLYFSLYLSLFPMRVCFSLPFFLHFPPSPLLSLSLPRTRILFLSPRFFFPLRRYFFLLVAHSFYASLPSLLWTYMRVSMREEHRKPVYTVEYIVAAIRWNVRCAPLWLVTFFLVFFFTPFWLWTLLFFFFFFSFWEALRWKDNFIKRIMLFEVSILLGLKEVKVKIIGKSEIIFIDSFRSIQLKKWNKIDVRELHGIVDILSRAIKYLIDLFY